MSELLIQSVASQNKICMALRQHFVHALQGSLIQHPKQCKEAPMYKVVMTRVHFLASLQCLLSEQQDVLEHSLSHVNCQDRRSKFKLNLFDFLRFESDANVTQNHEQVQSPNMFPVNLEAVQNTITFTLNREQIQSLDTCDFNCAQSVKKKTGNRKRGKCHVNRQLCTSNRFATLACDSEAVDSLDEFLCSSDDNNAPKSVASHSHTHAVESHKFHEQ